jgi:hypothetical protein
VLISIESDTSPPRCAESNHYGTMNASSPFLLTLRRGLLEDFEAELLLASRVAVLQVAGWKRSEIGRGLDATPAALRAAYARVDRVTERL